MTADETDADDTHDDPSREDPDMRERDVVLVTGCSSGTGQATARAFLDDEWRVYATARDADDLTDLAEAGCRTAELDVTDTEQVRAVVDRVLDETGRIDCLVNNAGYAQFGPLEDVPVEKVRRQYDVNVLGVHRLTRAVLPHMRKRDEGTIVNLSSAGGRLAHPGGSAYCGSKFAVEGLSDALRAEVRKEGVDVVVVEPGPVDTRFLDRAEDEVADLNRTGAYDAIYRAIDDSRAFGGGGPGAISPEAVADVVLDAAVQNHPAARYPVGPLARGANLARFVPERLRDRLWGLAQRII